MMKAWPARFGLLRTLWSEARLASRLLRDPQVPVVTKALPLLALLYVVAPVDLMPDLVPLLGQLDDLALLVGVTQLFRRISPPRVVAYHQNAAARRQRYSPMPPTADVIDAEFRREDA